jgi:hypothetical protein
MVHSKKKLLSKIRKNNMLIIRKQDGGKILTELGRRFNLTGISDRLSNFTIPKKLNLSEFTNIQVNQISTDDVQTLRSSYITKVQMKITTNFGLEYINGVIDISILFENLKQKLTSLFVIINKTSKETVININDSDTIFEQFEDPSNFLELAQIIPTPNDTITIHTMTQNIVNDLKENIQNNSFNELQNSSSRNKKLHWSDPKRTYIAFNTLAMSFVRALNLDIEVTFILSILVYILGIFAVLFFIIFGNLMFKIKGKIFKFVDNKISDTVKKRYRRFSKFFFSEEKVAFKFKEYDASGKLNIRTRIIRTGAIYGTYNKLKLQQTKAIQRMGLSMNQVGLVTQRDMDIIIDIRHQTNQYIGKFNLLFNSGKNKIYIDANKNKLKLLLTIIYIRHAYLRRLTKWHKTEHNNKVISILEILINIYEQQLNKLPHTPNTMNTLNVINVSNNTVNINISDNINTLRNNINYNILVYAKRLIKLLGITVITNKIVNKFKGKDFTIREHKKHIILSKNYKPKTVVISKKIAESLISKNIIYDSKSNSYIIKNLIIDTKNSNNNTLLNNNNNNISNKFSIITHNREQAKVNNVNNTIITNNQMKIQQNDNRQWYKIIACLELVKNHNLLLEMINDKNSINSNTNINQTFEIRDFDGTKQYDILNIIDIIITYLNSIIRIYKNKYTNINNRTTETETETETEKSLESLIRLKYLVMNLIYENNAVIRQRTRYNIKQAIKHLNDDIKSQFTVILINDIKQTHNTLQKVKHASQSSKFYNNHQILHSDNSEISNNL